MKMFKRRLPIKYLILTCFTFLCFIMFLGVTTGKTYGADGEAICAKIFLDTIEPDDTAPDAIMGYELVTVVSNQEDVSDENGTQSGIGQIEYGYKLTTEGEYTWVDRENISDLSIGSMYDFVTRSSDKAGNTKVSKVTTKTVENVNVPIFLIDNVHNISTSNKSYMKSEDRISITILAKTTAYSYNSLDVSEIIIKVGDVEITPTTKKLSPPIIMSDGVKWTLTLSGVSGSGELTITIPENKVLDTMSNGNVETILYTGTKVDTIVPSNVSVSINGGDEISNSKNVLLTLNAENADYVYVNNTGIAPNENDTAWFEFVTSKYHELVGNVGINTVYVWFKDMAGNIVGPQTDTIEIGTVESSIKATIFLDDCNPDDTAPSVSVSNGTVKTICMQKDVDKDGVKSGISSILYGYKVNGTSEYSWNTTNEMKEINTTNTYDFTTKSIDAAGNETISKVTTMLIEENTIPTIEMGNIYNISTNNSSYIKSTDRISIIFFAKTNDFLNNTLTLEDIIIRAGNEVINPTVKKLSEPILTENGVKWSLTLEGVTGNGELNLIIPENKVLNGKYEGNLEKILNTGSMIDNILPSGCSVAINNGATETSSKNVLLAISATDADYIYVNNTGIAPNENEAGWVEYVTTKYHELIGNTGSNVVYVWFKDFAGNIVGPISDEIEITKIEETIKSSIFLDDCTPDDTAPNVSSSNGIVKIISMQKDLYKDGVKSGISSVQYGYKAQGETEYTWINTNETKNINVTNEYDFVTKATDAANNATISQVTTILVEEDTTPKIELEKIYNLSTYNASYIKSTDRIQIVFKAKTTDYKENNLTSEDIILKVGNEIVNPSTKSLTEPVQTTEGLVWKITLSGISGNGLLTMSIPENKVFNTKYEGNIETILNTGSVVDNEAPTNYSVAINNGEEATQAIGVTLNINATGADYMYISNAIAAPGENNAGWCEYVGTSSHTLVGEKGTNSVYVWFKDIAGNIAGYATDSIEVTELDQAIQATIFLDTEMPDITAPSVSPVNRSVKVVSNQRDVNKDGVKSGISKIEYGYRLHGSTDEYVFQSSDIITDIIGDQTYDFVTRATDFAGNVRQSEATTILIEADTTPVFKLDYKKNISTSNPLFIKQADIVEIGISVDSSRYHTNELKVEDLKVTVGGVENNDLAKDLSLLSSTANGEKWKLILGNVTGNGEILIEIPENIAFDVEGNGNVSSILEPLMTVDNIAPTNSSISLLNGAMQTINQDTLINISSIGARYMYISNETNVPTEFLDVWVEYTNQKYHRLTDNYGDKTVYAWFKDEAGNISEMVSDGIEYVANTEAIQDEIFLDTLAPTKTPPTLLFSTYVTISCHQEDPFADGGYKSGIAKIEYGYRLAGSTDAFTYQTSNILYNVPSADYYEFVTRATDAAGNVSVSGITVEYVDITDIYVDVMFEIDNGTVSPRVKTYKYGENYTDLPTVISQPGFVFKGWYTEKDGAGTLIEEGMEITNKYNHTLYAFQEEHRDLSEAVVTLNPESLPYTGTPREPDTIVDFGGKTLTRDIDYTVTYRDNINVGTGYVKITGKGTYIGSVELPFEITPNLAIELNVTLDNYVFVWNNSEHKPKPTVSIQVDGEEKVLEEGKDYTVGYANNIEPGNNAEVIITGINNFSVNSAIEKFTIERKSISYATIALGRTEYTYDGTAKTPTVAVELSGETLREGTHYTVKYEKNTEAGTAKVIITGIGNYQGTREVTFTIHKADLGLTVNGYTGIYDGKEHTVELSGGELTGATVTYSTDGVNYTSTKPTYKNVGNNTVYVKVEKANYNTFTGNAKVEISVKEVAVSWGSTTLTYTGNSQVPVVGINNTLAGVNGEILNIEVEGKETNVGTNYTATAKIVSVTNGEVTNYVLEETSKTIEYEIIVNTATILTIELQNPSEVLTYNGQEQTPEVVVKDGAKILTTDDYTLSHENNVNAGENTARAMVTGKGNYAGINGSVTFTIGKRELIVTPKTGQGKVYGEAEKAIDYDYANNVSTETPEFTGALTREEGSSVGTYAINKGTLALIDKGSFLANNYTLIYNDNNVTYAITEKDITGMTVELEQGTYAYTGAAITPKAIITYNGVVLGEADCTVTYENNTIPGQAIVKVTGKGNFKGEATTAFTITAGTMTGITISGYSGVYDKQTHGITVTLSETSIGANVKYGTEINNCNLNINPEYKNVGTYTVYYEITKEYYNTVTGSAEVIITPKDITDKVVLEIPTQEYIGSDITPKPEIKDDDTTLELGRDYELNFLNNINVGEATIIIKFIGNYTGTKNGTFKIELAENTEFDVSLSTYTYIYDGIEKRPEVTVKTMLGGNEVILNESDYEVTYSNNIEPRTTESIPTVTITGKGNFAGVSKVVEFTIEKANRNANVVMTDYRYGQEQEQPELDDEREPGTTVYYYSTENKNNGGILWSTVTDSKYLNTGIYYMYAEIAETAHYKAEVTPPTRFEILKGYAVHPTVENKVYNGHAQVGVYGGEGIIIKGEFEAIDVGTYSAYAEIDGLNYMWAPDDGVKEYIWKITPCDINNTVVTLTPDTFMYNGHAHEPQVEVILNNEFTLIKDVDFKVTFEDNVNAGEAKAVITGINNYSGLYKKSFTIEQALLSKVEIQQTEYTYTGAAIKPIEKVYDANGNLLVKDRDYSVYYENNIEIGIATIGAVGKGNYAGSVETEFRIIGEPLTNAQIKLSGFPLVYDGEEKRPHVEVIINGNKLVRGSDFELEFENNINAGENTAIVRVIGRGKYTGYAEKTFTIMKANRIPDIVPGKAVIVGQTDVLEYSYEGEYAETILVVENESIASAKESGDVGLGFIDITGKAPGKTILKITVAATENYNELVMRPEITVFEKLENAHPIYGTVIINDGAKYTISPRVMLKLNVDFGEYMYISESNIAPSVDDEEWYEFSKKIPYLFEDVEGEKTIYVWFKDDNGNISEMATDSIILDYESGVPAPDSVLLDQTDIDQTAPEVEINKQHNDGIDLEVIFKQKDVMVNGVRSGVDHSTIKYGYKEKENVSGDYIWQDTAIIKNLKYNTGYIIVTQAYDRAGNGPVISDERIVQTERRFNITLTLEDLNLQYTGKVQSIDEVEYELINDTPITGKLTYTYYVDEDCTIVTTLERDGSAVSGGAPANPGIYYVKAELKEDNVYYDTESNVAELRIGWDISKTADDNVFAYLERKDVDKNEYILNVIGDGNMADLEELLIRNNDEALVYWANYKNNIEELKLTNIGDDSITNIGASIFNNLNNITEINIPDTVVKIGKYAFEGCSNVNTNINIPLSVEKIGGGAFANVNTPAFEVAYGSEYFDTIDGVLVNAEHTELVAYPNGKLDEKYIIPETIKTIKEASFLGADNIKDVVIPNGVEAIETKAFYGCTNLKIVEIEDLMENDDNIMELITVETKAFEGIAKGSVIYTFSEAVAKEFTAGKTHIATDTEVYWPPVITLQPIDMNGSVGTRVKFIIDTKAGYPLETKYQWFRVDGNTETLISGATGKEYTTPALTTSDNNVYYYCRVYNVDYYYNRGYLNSNKAKITMLDNANYLLERGTYNTYLFETLEDAFEFAINDDVIKVLQTVNNENGATLKDNKAITLDLNTNTINLVGKVEIDEKSKLNLIGNGGIVKSGDYIFENKGELILNGAFTLSNSIGYGIKVYEDAKLEFTSGNIIVDSNAIYAENAEITINGANAIITVRTNSQNANAIELHKGTKFEMTAGNVSIEHVANVNEGNISAIHIVGDAQGIANISGGAITATSTGSIADAITNAGSSDVIISGTTAVTGSRSGIHTSGANSYGDIIIRSGVISGGEYGILNNAEEAKVVLGKEGDGVSVAAPIIVGEKAAIFNTKEQNTLEVYDGILYSHGQNIIYEELNNTDLTISNANTDAIYTEQGRKLIRTEKKYSLAVEENITYNGSTYKAAYLSEDKIPTLSGIEDQVVEVGEKAVFEIIATGGVPNRYNYEWQVSTDNGVTWSTITVGTGMNTSKYTTPISTIAMDGYMYRCIVSNEKMKVTSKAVTLYVVQNNELGGERPIVRIVFTDGRTLAYENNKKLVNMQIIVKTFDELETLKLNGKTIYERVVEIVNGEEIPRVVEYTYPNEDILEISKVANSPILIKKEINGKEQVVEYTYTYNMKVYANEIITVEAEDVKGRENVATQTVDLFHNLKVEYYLSELTQTNDDLVITFYANKPVIPTKSVVNSYINSTYLDLVALDNSEYSYRYTLALERALPETEFWFEDIYKNETHVTVEAITRTKYKNVKFNKDTLQIEDLTVIDAYELAQEIENATEVNRSEEIQSRYGINSVQADAFMSRARDLGAMDILNNSKKIKAYTGVLTSTIKATLTTSDEMHNSMAASGNLFVAAAAKNMAENELSSNNRRYMDIITKELSLYKGINIPGFRIDDSAPYMYVTPSGATNIPASAIAEAAFRATIIAK